MFLKVTSVLLKPVACDGQEVLLFSNVSIDLNYKLTRVSQLSMISLLDEQMVDEVTGTLRYTAIPKKLPYRVEPAAVLRH